MIGISRTVACLSSQSTEVPVDLGIPTSFLGLIGSLEKINLTSDISSSILRLVEIRAAPKVSNPVSAPETRVQE